MAWYRKYRPQRAADLQITPVREQILKLLQTGKVSHAYLFAGPKGTGKTSTARILARILNDPKNEKVVLGKSGKLAEPDPQNPLLQKIAAGHSQVVLELDAASHRGIDDIRRLQEMVAVAPTEGLVRVVILDEVHMLTNEAFNALLKLLEEPPERVAFILATTELQKVPATIQSRCELVQFRHATLDEIAAALQTVAEGEKFALPGETARQIAEAAQGSFRDAVKYLEQVARGGAVDEQALARLTVGSQRLELLLRALAARDPQEVTQIFQDVRQKGENFSSLEQALVLAVQERLHRAIARAEKPQTTRTLVELLGHLAQRLGGPEPVDGIKLEVACLSWCLEKGFAPGLAETQPVATKASAACAWEIPTTTATLEEAKQQAKQERLGLETTSLTTDQVAETWPRLMLAARTKSKALEAILSQAKLGSAAGSTIGLEFELGFHKQQIESKKYRSFFLELLEETFGEGVNFAAAVLPKPVEVPVDPGQSQDSLVRAVEEAVLSLG